MDPSQLDQNEFLKNVRERAQVISKNARQKPEDLADKISKHEEEDEEMRQYLAVIRQTDKIGTYDAMAPDENDDNGLDLDFASNLASNRQLDFTKERFKVGLAQRRVQKRRRPQSWAWTATTDNKAVQIQEMKGPSETALNVKIHTEEGEKAEESPKKSRPQNRFSSPVFNDKLMSDLGNILKKKKSPSEMVDTETSVPRSSSPVQTKKSIETPPSLSSTSPTLSPHSGSPGVSPRSVSPSQMLQQNQKQVLKVGRSPSPDDVSLILVTEKDVFGAKMSPFLLRRTNDGIMKKFETMETGLGNTKIEPSFVKTLEKDFQSDTNFASSSLSSRESLGRNEQNDIPLQSNTVKVSSGFINDQVKLNRGPKAPVPKPKPKPKLKQSSAMLLKSSAEANQNKITKGEEKSAAKSKPSWLEELERKKLNNSKVDSADVAKVQTKAVSEDSSLPAWIHKEVASHQKRIETSKSEDVVAEIDLTPKKPQNQEPKQPSWLKELNLRKQKKEIQKDGDMKVGEIGAIDVKGNFDYRSYEELNKFEMKSKQEDNTDGGEQGVKSVTELKKKLMTRNIEIEKKGERIEKELESSVSKTNLALDTAHKESSIITGSSVQQENLEFSEKDNHELEAENRNFSSPSSQSFVNLVSETSLGIKDVNKERKQKDVEKEDLDEVMVDKNDQLDKNQMLKHHVEHSDLKIQESLKLENNFESLNGTENEDENQVADERNSTVDLQNADNSLTPSTFGAHWEKELKSSNDDFQLVDRFKTEAQCQMEVIIKEENIKELDMTSQYWSVEKQDSTSKLDTVFVETKQKDDLLELPCNLENILNASLSSDTKIDLKVKEENAFQASSHSEKNQPTLPPDSKNDIKEKITPPVPSRPKVMPKLKPKQFFRKEAATKTFTTTTSPDPQEVHISPPVSPSSSVSVKPYFYDDGHERKKEIAELDLTENQKPTQVYRPSSEAVSVPMTLETQVDIDVKSNSLTNKSESKAGSGSNVDGLPKALRGKLVRVNSFEQGSLSKPKFDSKNENASERNEGKQEARDKLENLEGENGLSPRIEGDKDLQAETIEVDDKNIKITEKVPGGEKENVNMILAKRCVEKETDLNSIYFESQSIAHIENAQTGSKDEATSNKKPERGIDSTLKPSKQSLSNKRRPPPPKPKPKPKPRVGFKVDQLEDMRSTGGHKKEEIQMETSQLTEKENLRNIEKSRSVETENSQTQQTKQEESDKASGERWSEVEFVTLRNIDTTKARQRPVSMMENISLASRNDSKESYSASRMGSGTRFAAELEKKQKSCWFRGAFDTSDIHVLEKFDDIPAWKRQLLARLKSNEGKKVNEKSSSNEENKKEISSFRNRTVTSPDIFQSKNEIHDVKNAIVEEDAEATVQDENERKIPSFLREFAAKKQFRGRKESRDDQGAPLSPTDSKNITTEKKSHGAAWV